jgi:hypothetical protein
VDAVLAGMVRMKLVHFYHVYADGAFEEPLVEHFEALENSGLWDQFDSINVGIVGSSQNRRRALDLLPACDIVRQAETGWEQVTLQEVHDFAKWEMGSCGVLYAHTKGASSRSELAKQWRRSMTEDLIKNWKLCVAKLALVDAVGSHWLKSGEPEHRDHDHFFAGNFWWATTNYLATLPKIKNEHRFQAEGWIGLGDPEVFVPRPGLATFGNFFQS